MGLASWARASEASPRARQVALFTLCVVSLCFPEIRQKPRQKRPKPLNIRNAYGELSEAHL